MKDRFVSDLRWDADRATATNIWPLKEFMEQKDPGYCQAVLDQLRGLEEDADGKG